MGSIFLRFPVFPTSEINTEKVRGWIVGADDWTEGWEEGSFQSSSVDERKNNHLLFVERVDRAVRRGLGSSSQSSTTITKTITIPTGRGSTGMSRRSWLHIRRTTPIIPIVHGYNNEEVFWKYVQAVDLVDFFDVSDLGVASQSLSQSSSTTIRQKTKTTTTLHGILCGAWWLRLFGSEEIFIIRPTISYTIIKMANTTDDKLFLLVFPPDQSSIQKSDIVLKSLFEEM